MKTAFAKHSFPIHKLVAVFDKKTPSNNNPKFCNKKKQSNIHSPWAMNNDRIWKIETVIYWAITLLLVLVLLWFNIGRVA